ncbi:MAG: multicopper oxidase domain-containing protein [Gemmatimonadota bacterium]
MVTLALALFATACDRTSASADSSEPATRTYYIAADEVEWDYAPTGINQLTGEPFDSIAAIAVGNGPHRIGRVYRKALYREYTDDTFTELKPRSPDWEHLGFLGPVIRGEVGDTLRVVFRNNTRFPASVHPHGVFYDKSSEGAPYLDGTGDRDKEDDGVPPGATHAYVWSVPERAGPGDHDLSTILWMYHSSVEEEKDVNSGLAGPMLISRPGTLGPDGKPRDVDREFVVAFAEVDENLSWYLEDNYREHAARPEQVTIVRAGRFGGVDVIASSGSAEERVDDSNFKETMNGFVFGHLPGLRMQVGERVRWYLMSSTNFEFHSPHWHGNTVSIEGMNTDIAGLLPMEMLTAEMTPDNPGTWLFHCHVGPHQRLGMSAIYTVQPAEVEPLVTRADD